MIDPSHITDYNRDQGTLEEFLVFAVLAAGKPADRMAALTHKLCWESEWLGTEPESEDSTPLARIWWLHANDALEDRLMDLRTGQYARISACLGELALRGYYLPARNLHQAARTDNFMPQISENAIDLHLCSPQDLEEIAGIGPKTSRFFILHSRPFQQYAVLDTHILAEMREWGLDAPKMTPGSSRRYAELEEAFLMRCKLMGTDPATLDLAIWNKRSKNSTL